MFKPSLKLAGQAILALRAKGSGRKSLLAAHRTGTLGFMAAAPARPSEDPALHLDATSKRLPSTDEPDAEQARAAIGERLEELIYVLSRERGTLEPGTSVLILDKKSRFTVELRDRFAEIFGDREPDEDLRRVLDKLGVEFRKWIEKNTKEQKRLGLHLEADRGVVLDCPEPPSPLKGLSPLPPLDR